MLSVLLLNVFMGSIRIPIWVLCLLWPRVVLPDVAYQRKADGRTGSLVLGVDPSEFCHCVQNKREFHLCLSSLTFFKNTFLFKIFCLCRAYFNAPGWPIKTFADVQFDQSWSSWLCAWRRGADGRSQFGEGREWNPQLWKKGDILGSLSASNQKRHQTLCYCSGRATRQGHGMNAALSPV